MTTAAKDDGDGDGDDDGEEDDEDTERDRRTRISIPRVPVISKQVNHKFARFTSVGSRVQEKSRLDTSCDVSSVPMFYASLSTVTGRRSSTDANTYGTNCYLRLVKSSPVIV